MKVGVPKYVLRGPAGGLIVLGTSISLAVMAIWLLFNEGLLAFIKFAGLFVLAIGAYSLPVLLPILLQRRQHTQSQTPKNGDFERTEESAVDSTTSSPSSADQERRMRVWRQDAVKEDKTHTAKEAEEIRTRQNRDFKRPEECAIESATSPSCNTDQEQRIQTWRETAVRETKACIAKQVEAIPAHQQSDSRAMYIFLDTETTGVAPSRDHLVQVAWILTDAAGVVRAEECHVVQPNGYSIPWQATQIHGITTEDANRRGKPLAWVLTQLTMAAAQAGVVVAHNLSFDIGMLASGYTSAHQPFPFRGKVEVCTMKLSTQWCALPRANSSSSFKYPKLTELHYRLFGEAFPSAHDALSDTRAVRRCYFRLVELGVIPPPTVELALDLASKTRAATKAHAPNSTEAPRAARGAAKLVGDDDADAFGEDLCDLARRIGIEAWRTDSAFLYCGGPSPAVTNDDIEGYGDELVGLLRRTAEAVRLAVGHPSSRHFESEPISNQDENNFGAELIDLMVRTAYQEFGFSELYQPICVVHEGDGQGGSPVDKPDPRGSGFSQDPIAVLERMSKHSVCAYRIIAAGHTKCPAQILGQLSVDSNSEVVRAALENPALPPDALERRYRVATQADDGYPTAAFDEDTVLRVLRHPNCPERLMFEYLETHDPEWWECYEESIPYNMAIAQNPGCTSRILAMLFWSSCFDGAVQRAVMSNPRFSSHVAREVMEELVNSDEACTYASWDECHPDLLDRLSKSNEAEVLNELAQNLAASPRALDALAKSNNVEVLIRVAANPSASPQTLDTLFKSNNPQVLIEVAGNPSASSGTLTRLSLSDDAEVRMRVAANPSTSPHTLVYLAKSTRTALGNPSHPVHEAKDPESNIDRLFELLKFNCVETQIALATNAKSSTGLLLELAKHANPHVRSLVLQHHNATREMLLTLSAHSDEDLRMRIAGLKNCPKSLFPAFCIDPSPMVRVAAAENGNCTVDGLIKLARSEFYDYRLLALQHRNCTRQICEDLSNDPDKVVRDTARRVFKRRFFGK